MKKLAVLFALITGAFLSGFTGEGFAGAIAPAVTAGQPEAVNTGVTPVCYHRYYHRYHRYYNGDNGYWGRQAYSGWGGGSYGFFGRPAYYGYGASAWAWWPFWDFPQNILR
jgi:hypothetical protein